MLFYPMPFHPMPFHPMLFHPVLFRPMLFHPMLFFPVLFRSHAFPSQLYNVVVDLQSHSITAQMQPRPTADHARLLWNGFLWCEVPENPPLALK